MFPESVNSFSKDFITTFKTVGNVISINYCDTNKILPSCLLFQRSFRKELFDDAASRMERAVIKTPLELERFRDLAKRAAEIVIQNQKREIDFSDAPEEFRGIIFHSHNTSTYQV